MSHAAPPSWPPPQPPTAVSDVSLVLQTIASQQTAIMADVSALREGVGRALTHLEVIDQRNKNADELHRDYEARLRLLESAKASLEASRAKLIGVAIGVSTAISIVGGFIGHVVFH